MATQPHHDDDQSKNPDHAHKSPKTPKPKPPVPNMELDDAEEALFVDEVIEEEAIPVLESADEEEPVVVAEEVVVEAAPASDVVLAEEAEEVVEVAPLSEVVLADEALRPHPADSPPVLSQPPTGVRTGPVSPPPTVAESAPAATVPAPTSDVDLMQMFDEPANVEPEVAEEVVAEEVVEEAAPLSDVLAAEEVVEEAMPASEVKAEDEVLGVEEIVDAEPVVDAESTEEYVEAMEEPSSATRKAEAVLDDEVVAAEEADEVLGAEEVVAAGSSAVLFDELAEEEPGAKKTGTEEFQVASSTKKRTVPFESPGSAAKKSEDELVTEEELVGSSEASAVNLGDMPARRGSSVTGIDKVAEALESGIDLEPEDAEPAEAAEASVVFDEALEDLGDSDEGSIEFPRGKKAVVVNDEGSTDMEQDALAELGAIEESGSGAKKGKKPKPASDEVDLESLFDEEEAESAQPIEAAGDVDATVAYDSTEMGEAVEFDDVAKDSSAEVAEPAESSPRMLGGDVFDAEAEAAEALDDESVDLGAPPEEEKPSAKKLKGKKKAAVAEDEDEMAATSAEDDDSGARKKKGKKKELAAVAPEARPGRALPLLGGMFVGGLLVAVAAGAVVFLAPDLIPGTTKAPVTGPQTKITPKLDKTRAEQARGLMDQGKYKEAVTLLEAANDPTDVATRGEARWLDYVKRQTADKAPLDKNADEVKKARADLTGKDLLVAQIDATIDGKAKEKEAAELAEKLKLADAAKDTNAKELQEAKMDKAKAEKEYAAVADALVNAKLIEDKSKFDAKALPKILKEISEEKATLDNVNKLLKDAEVKDAGDKGVKALLDSKKDAEDKLTAVNKVLEDEKIKDPGAKGILAIVDARNKSAKERDDLLASISAAFNEFVDGKIVPADADPRKQLVEGAKLARLKAESPLAIPLLQLGQQLSSVGSGAGKFVEKSFDAARLAAALSFYKTREPLIQSPQQKLDTDIGLLQDRRRNNPKELAPIMREADWVLAPESKSGADARGKARYVQGLALRNLEKFDEARAAFDDAVKLAAPAAWTESVKHSKLELTDPNVYYVPLILGHGDLKAALAETNAALKAMPAEASLFALRALIRVELIRGQGAKTAADDQKAIRADAAAAARDAKQAAYSAYVLGLLEEELGNWSEAEKLLRQALKLHQGTDDEAGKYRVALARLLLRDRPEGAAAPVAPAPEKKDAAAPSAVERTIVMHPWSLLAVTAIIAQAGDDEVEDPASAARLKETIDLANQLIASKNDKIKGQGYLVLGSALSRQGKRTEGIKEYVKGLKLLYPGIESAELAKLIAEHPAFQQPDAGGNDPIQAERHYGEGYHLFWAGKYAEAETQFKKAVSLFDKDARYQYFLGLALYQQKTKTKRDAAYYAWEQGARQETKAATNPFAVREINASLERVQGNERQLLNSYRSKAAEEAEVK